MIEAAITCLASHGYHGCSVPRIAEIAGVSRGAQSHQFPTKADLLNAVIADLIDRASNGLDSALAGKVDLLERLSGFFDHLWNGSFRGERGAALLELILAARSDAELRKTIQAQTKRRVEAFTAAWQLALSDVKADSTVIRKLGAMTDVFLHGMALMAFHVADEDQLRDVRNKWLSMVIAEIGG